MAWLRHARLPARGALASWLVGLALLVVLVSCDPPVGVSPMLAPSPTAVDAPVAEAPPHSPAPSPSAPPPPTATPTATPTPTTTTRVGPPPTATPFVRSVSMVIEYGGKSYSKAIPAAEVAGLATLNASGARVPNAAAIRAIVDAFAKEHARPARNATFRWDAARGAPVVVSSAQVGLDVDKAETARRLTQAVTFAGPDVFPVAHELIEPVYSAANPPAIGKTVLATVGHHYNPAEPSGKNQEIGVRYLDGTILLPGEVFSNDSLVYRQGANVYRESVVNAGDRNVLAPGGGLCSLATIGFQAAFLSGMEIVERHPHLYWIVSYAVTYRNVSYRGLDATTGNSRWRNTTGAPVRVHAWADGRQSHFQIVGTSPGWQISVASYSDRNFLPAPTTVQLFTDPKRPVGFTEVLRDSHDGRDVTVVRDVWKSGTLVRRDRFVSHYEAVGKQVLQGTKR